MADTMCESRHHPNAAAGPGRLLPAAPYVVLTGGPGAGKTTLIAALARAGFAVAEEAGRRVIREQQAARGRALPSVDPLAFARAMLAHDLASFDAHRTAQAPVFFDRGIPDVVGYLRLEDLPVPEDIVQAAREHRYARAFICPPWPDIYVTDAERRQTHEVAVRTYEAMVETYGGLGYDLVAVPRASVDERMRFILESLQAGA
jgi:predicted ATPase